MKIGTVVVENVGSFDYGILQKFNKKTQALSETFTLKGKTAKSIKKLIEIYLNK